MDERISSGSYDGLRAQLVPFIHKLLNAKEYPERLILTAVAVLDNNCFEISMPLRGVEMGGLFLTSLILCHDCVPNTKHFVNFIEADVDIQRYQMTFQTTGETSQTAPQVIAVQSCLFVPVPVRKGEQLTTTYTNTLKTTLERRRHLRQTKIFDCDCERCRDPTEMSTYGSAMVCERCGGRVCSMDPLDEASAWMCDECKSRQSHEV